MPRNFGVNQLLKAICWQTCVKLFILLVLLKKHFANVKTINTFARTKKVWDYVHYNLKNKNRNNNGRKLAIYHKKVRWVSACLPADRAETE